MELVSQMRCAGFSKAEGVSSKRNGSKGCVRREVFGVPSAMKGQPTAHVEQWPAASSELKCTSNRVRKRWPQEGHIS